MSELPVLSVEAALAQCIAAIRAEDLALDAHIEAKRSAQETTKAWSEAMQAKDQALMALESAVRAAARA